MVGGSVLRGVGRTVAGGVRGPFSASRSAKPAGVVLRVSSSGATSPRASSSPTFASAAGSASGWSSHSGLVDGEEWERVREEAAFWDEEAAVEFWDEEAAVDGAGFHFVERFVFGQAPSREEAEDGVSTLQQILGPVVCPQVVDQKPQVGDDAIEKETASLNALDTEFSSESSEGCQSDWIEPAMQFYSSNSFKSKDQEKVLDALQLFRTSASLQSVVVSISSDRAVWDAVMNNAAVQELKNSLCDGASKSNVTGKSDEHTDAKDTGPFWRIFHNAKAKIREFMEQITKLANEIFHSQNNDQMNENEAFDGVVRSSLMISIIVFVLIIMKRLQNSST